VNGASISTLAGIASTVIFASSALPMLAKARRSRDLASYSLGNMLLSNAGNAVHSIYVFSLPPGPIWALHAFYVVSTGLMLFWFLRYAGERRTRIYTILRMWWSAKMHDSPDAEASHGSLAS
jgi:hypothetical protein